jgi:PadR family transcriptional regulator PadR
MVEAAQTDSVLNWSRQLRKGVLEFLVLLRLREREYYGYELVHAVAETAGGEVAEGTLYPLLSRLTRQELIRSRWDQSKSGRRRRYYRITPHGETVLADMTDRWIRLDRAIRRLSK